MTLSYLSVYKCFCLNDIHLSLPDVFDKEIREFDGLFGEEVVWKCYKVHISSLSPSISTQQIKRDVNLPSKIITIIEN